MRKETQTVELTSKKSARGRRVTDNGDGEKKSARQVVTIKPPNFKYAIFTIRGTEGPLVVHRFSHKVKREMAEKMKTGKAASSKRNRDPQDLDELFNASRYISPEGWDGFNASAIRASMISVCRLVGFKMSLAKMSIFIERDGVDAKEPQIPLIRIYGDKAKFQDDVGRVQTGEPYITVRAAYHNWYAKPKIKWDADQFTLEDVTNLLVRVGAQNGLCEGRDNSKHSTGMGWGRFTVDRSNE